MSKQHVTISKRARRHKKVRVLVRGSEDRPRLSIFKSNRGLYAQLINDDTGHTIAAASSLALKGSMQIKAKVVGEEIGKLGKAKKITAVVFDRGGFRYAGNVKTLAEAARGAGLNF